MLTRSQARRHDPKIVSVVNKYRALNPSQQKKVATRVRNMMAKSTEFLHNVSVCSDTKYYELVAYANERNIISRYSVTCREEFINKCRNISGTDLGILMGCFYHERVF